MTGLEIALTIYALTVGFQAFLASVLIADQKRISKKYGARLIILLPLAPLLFLRLGIEKLCKFYRFADFKNKDTK